MSTRVERNGLAVALTLACACSVDLSAPVGAQIGCHEHDECPTGMLCDPETGLCVRKDTLAGVPCSEDAECRDGSFCNGAEKCLLGHCRSGDVPCVSSFDCVSVTCDETAGQCNLTVDHDQCDEGSYCSPTVGCTPGTGCLNDADCQDSSTCNGAERCIGFQCMDGPLPVVDDEDLCTVDGCDDSRISEDLPAIYHVADPNLDGNSCVRPGTGGLAGICVAARDGCVESTCGDGVVDPATSEVCDEGDQNRETWMFAPGCALDCMSFAPFCGDGETDTPHESCDDGNTTDDANGCDALCARNDQCGDGVLQLLFETCDDGNDGNDCDGCRDGCQLGCDCSPDNCAPGTWCNLGICDPCDQDDHCGPYCEVCTGQTPICGGQVEGCLCVQGSCFPHGLECIAGLCDPCDEPSRCGPDCVACSDPTPDCGGEEAGCVVHADGTDDGCAGQPDFTRCVVVSDPDRSYDICIDGVCVSPGCGDISCNVPGPGFTIPDTNQRECSDYDVILDPCPSSPSEPDCATTPYCGQDAQYGWDVEHSTSERFSRGEPVADEPLVQDLVTGLVWQGCLSGLRGSSCELSAITKLDWHEALAHCDGLEWGGYRDWRLPDHTEMHSIVDYKSGSGGIDPVVFPGTPTNYPRTWSGTTDALSSGSAVAWDQTAANRSPKTEDNYVRCVRGQGTGRLPLSRTSTTQPVLVDASHALVWQGCPAGLSGADCDSGTLLELEWMESLDYCQDLDWAGEQDWYLPDIKELGSLPDMRSNAPLGNDLLPGLASGWLTSSTTSGGASGVFFVWGAYGTVGSTAKGIARSFVCVRKVP